ncbi:MAG: ribonuclease P protein component [Candidatus Competibacteraceae bacterium]|nr:MAG: ribonuclease P protein component [Candidatus Competibacteraceae bacterium]
MTSGGDARLPRRARLTGARAYTRVFAHPSKSSDRYFTVLARPNALAYPRLGLAISRKVARSAVARNRLKRLVRESFRHHQGRLGGLDVVVMGRVGLVEPDNAVLAAALERHWRRLARSCALS